MLSSILPTAGDHFSSDGFLGSGFFETGGFTPWDTQENLSVFPPQEPIFSFSGTDSDPKTNSSNSGSEEGDPTQQEVSGVDERKWRRMISNRESARRSRMRKQKHLENLRNRVNRFKTANQELKNRLRFVDHRCQLFRQENEWLRSESVMLRQRLWDIRQVLLVRQLNSSAWPCNNYVEKLSSLIT